MCVKEFKDLSDFDLGDCYYAVYGHPNALFGSLYQEDVFK